MEPKVVTWPVEPGSRAFVDIRLQSGVTIENFGQDADPRAARAVFEALARQGYAMIEQAGDDADPWYARATVVALRFRDKSQGIVTPGLDLVTP